MTEFIVISPCYNEERNIRKFVKAMTHVVKKDDFLIIDDGSTDDTPEILKKLGVNTLFMTHKGKGAVIKRGIEIALKKNARYVIFLDSDLQHPPELIPVFIEKLRKGADIVIGSRWKSLYMMPKDRYLSNRLTTFFVSLLTGKRILDSQSGYRGYRTDILSDIDINTQNYETETEILIKLLKSRKVNKIDYVDIPVIYHGEDSKIHKLRDTMRFLKMYFGILWKTA